MDHLPEPAIELWHKVVPLGMIFFCASFNLTILQVGMPAQPGNWVTHHAEAMAPAAMAPAAMALLEKQLCRCCTMTAGQQHRHAMVVHWQPQQWFVLTQQPSHGKQPCPLLASSSACTVSSSSVH